MTSFKYLGAIVSGEGSKPKVFLRNEQATAALWPCSKTETKVVWSYLKVFWLSKDDSAGHRKKKERETEEELGRQY